nr:unnamed protein product [Callosobruchus analis]
MSEASDIEENLESEKFETPAILLEVGGEPLPALLDSGSEVTAISEKLYNKLVDTLKFPVLPVTKVSISVATGNIKQRIKKQVLLPIWLSDIGKQIDIRCLVVPGLNCDILLGCDFLKNHNVVVDFKTAAASVTIENNKHLINFVSCNEVDNLTHINICKTVALFEEPKADVRANGDRYLDSDFSAKAEEAEADAEVKEQLFDLLQEHIDIFSECPGIAKSYVHRIEMNDVTPFNIANYPIPLVYRDQAEQRAAKLNAKVNPVIFKEGDKVLMRVHAQSSAEDRLIRKLFLLYEGPYIVQRQAGPNSYVLVDDQGSELPKQNVINLKAYKELPESARFGTSSIFRLSRSTVTVWIYFVFLLVKLFLLYLNSHVAHLVFK